MSSKAEFVSQKRFGCEVKDAQQLTKIHVKPEDIKGAVCGDHQKCAIARAILRQRKSTVKWVDVGASTILIGQSEKTATRYVLSKIGREQVRYFDTNQGAFAPCVVELRSPPASLAEGSRRGTKARSGKHKNKRKSKTPRQIPSR